MGIGIGHGIGRRRSGAPRAIGALGAVAALLCSSSAYAQQAEPGYAQQSVSVAPGGAFVGGFERLANGNWALFDGNAVVELSPQDGSFVRTLFTPPSFAFGAFLVNSPDGTKLYFGDSNNNEIWEIDLATLHAGVVLTIKFPYDLAFDPQGRPYVSYAFSLVGGSHVALCDFANDSYDDVVDSPAASGPLVFDPNGDLYCCTPDSSSFPPPLDASEVWRVAAADLAAAIGPSSFDITQGTLLGVVDGAYAMALDEGGDLLLSDANQGTLVELDPTDGSERLLATAGPFTAFLYARYEPATHGTFEPWQPAEGGALLAVRSDFFSLTEVTRVTPARPHLSVNPASPIPVGSFDLDVTGATPNGVALLFVCNGVAPELTVRHRTWKAPLFFALDFAGLQVVPLLLDGDGAYHEPLDNPGLAGLDLAAQLLTADSVAGPFRGTSEPLVVTLQ
ncbi:MAG: hypothetical protein JNL90_18210 [Planctomycetes bacterium]|nr:hypothetical protein [Planctomycetota bacterium]